MPPRMFPTAMPRLWESAALAVIAISGRFVASDKSRARRSPPRTRADGRARRSCSRGGCPRSTQRRPRQGIRAREARATCCGSVRCVITIAYDVDAVRARFSALDNGLTLFDGPGGTQVPDSVIAAVATYFRESNANVGGPY